MRLSLAQKPSRSTRAKVEVGRSFAAESLNTRHTREQKATEQKAHFLFFSYVCVYVSVCVCVLQESGVVLIHFSTTERPNFTRTRVHNHCHCSRMYVMHIVVPAARPHSTSYPLFLSLYRSACWYVYGVFITATGLARALTLRTKFCTSQLFNPGANFIFCNKNKLAKKHLNSWSLTLHQNDLDFCKK